MTKPGDDDRTPGRGRTRWGRQTEPPTTPPAAETSEEQEPAVQQATPRTAQSSSGPPAPAPSETPEAPADDGGRETPRPGPHLEYVTPEQTLGTLQRLGLTATVLPPPPTDVHPEVVPDLSPDVRIYRPVDRAVLSEPFFRKIEAVEDGKLLFTVQRAYNYPSGGFPGDPGQIPASVDPRVSVCWSLATGAASRCLRGGGYF